MFVYWNSISRITEREKKCQHRPHRPKRQLVGVLAMGITESRAVLGGLSTLPVHEGGAKSWEMRRKMKERSWEIRDEWIEIKTKRQGETLGACSHTVRLHTTSVCRYMDITQEFTSCILRLNWWEPLWIKAKDYEGIHNNEGRAETKCRINISLQ